MNTSTDTEKTKGLHGFNTIQVLEEKNLKFMG